MNRRQKIIVSVVGIFIVLLALVGITYGYFLTRIQGNTNTTSISVTTADLKLVYGDGNGKIEPSGVIMPSYTVSKTFTVHNDGNANINYSIIFEEVKNNFVRTEDWEYVLAKTGVTDPVATGTINNLEVQTILADIVIAPDVTDNYTLTITYKETNTDQSIDMNKTLSFLINIIETSAWEKANSGTLLHLLKTNNNLAAPVTVPGRTQSGLKFTEGNEYYNGLEEFFAFGDTATLRHANFSITYANSPDEILFNNEIGKYYFENPITCKYSECYEELVGKFFLLEDLSGYVNFASSPSTSTAVGYIYSVNLENIDFLVAQDSVIENEIDEAVLSTTKDDYGVSYYFRGDVQNNFINFSGMCWRIVRVQGNGGIKLALYNKDNTCQNLLVRDENAYYVEEPFVNTCIKYNSESFDDTQYISSPFDEKYLKFENSDLVDSINNWATSKGLLSNDNLMNTDWCNDLSITEEITNDDNTFTRYYGGYTRLNRVNAKPTLKCNMVGINGSRAIKYFSKFGILTADEIVYAGNVYENSDKTSSNSYIKDYVEKDAYWTMTPRSYYKGDGEWDYDHPGMFVDGGDYDGFLSEQPTFQDVNFGDCISLRPSIVLKPSVLATVNADVANYGEPGTYSNPYTVN